MRPYGIDDFDQLRIARERAAELRTDWQKANRHAPVERDGGSNGVIGSARTSAGRTLIGLGTALLPKHEPCA